MVDLGRVASETLGVEVGGVVILARVSPNTPHPGDTKVASPGGRQTRSLPGGPGWGGAAMYEVLFCNSPRACRGVGAVLVTGLSFLRVRAGPSWEPPPGKVLEAEGRLWGLVSELSEGLRRWE